MNRPSDERPDDEAVVAFLHDHHGRPPEDLEALHGGYWSAAYGYRVGDDELVLRLNTSPDGFRSDEAAQRYRSPAVPVPEIVAVGEGLDRWFAISRRHHGGFLEDVPPSRADVLGPTVVGLLEGLRAVPDTGVVTPPWRDWLLGGITDRADHHTSGWRAKVATHPDVDRTFRAVDVRIRSLLDACPDRRELVHGDLLHGNVLVTPTADAVTAVFSWKCATWGDAAYDLAWCTFWGRWHPGIGALDLWTRVTAAPHAGPEDGDADLAVRHHVYELHIGASHLGWYATLGDDENLRWTATQLDEILERGPHA